MKQTLAVVDKPKLTIPSFSVSFAERPPDEVDSACTFLESAKNI